MEKISVIIPVYNTEKYLKRCVDSVINQTYKNLQIILIDDGSTDNSLNICKELGNFDNRIEVIHTENKGQSAARNLGLSMAKGEYISFVDSDDWIALNLYEMVMKEFVKNKNIEVIDYICELTRNYTTDLINDNYKIEIVNEENILENFLYEGISSQKAPFSPCKKIYKSSCFHNVKFPEGRINEDIIFLYNVMSNIKCMGKCNFVGYYYFQNDHSTTIDIFKSRDFDLIKSCDEMLELSRQTNNKKIIKYARIKRARCDFSLLAKIAYYGIDKTLDKKYIVKNLTKSLRKNYSLLIFSKIAISRKILISAFCVNYTLCEKIICLKRKK